MPFDSEAFAALFPESNPNYLEVLAERGYPVARRTVTKYRELLPRGLDVHTGVWVTIKQEEALPQRYVSRRVTKSAWAEGREAVVQYELSQPVVPERPPREPEATLVRRRADVPASDSETLVGDRKSVV